MGACSIRSWNRSKSSDNTSRLVDAPCYEQALCCIGAQGDRGDYQEVLKSLAKEEADLVQLRPEVGGLNNIWGQWNEA